jgi:hypothetical protein
MHSAGHETRACHRGTYYVLPTTTAALESATGGPSIIIVELRYDITS